MTPAGSCPVGPQAQFFCEKYSCKLSRRACVLMQRKKKEVVNGRYIGPEGSFCISGKCKQGKLIALSLRGQHIEPAREVNWRNHWRIRIAIRKRDDTLDTPRKASSE